MPAQKLLPGRFTCAFRRRLDPVFLQMLAIVPRATRWPRFGQGALDPPVAPIPVLLCHAYHQGCQLGDRSRSFRTTSLATVIILLERSACGATSIRSPALRLWPLRPTLAVPASWLSPPTGAAGRRQISVDGRRSERAELGFLREEFDDLLLFLGHPPGNGDEQHPERIQSSWHLRRVSSSSHASLNAGSGPAFPLRSSFWTLRGRARCSVRRASGFVQIAFSLTTRL